MDNDLQESEKRKRAIFDSMSKRGQERVLRVGYENWDPFQEPKDPREKIRSSIALQADAIMRDFYATSSNSEDARAFHFELLELCQGFLREDLRARVILDFCSWYKEKRFK